MAISVFYAGIGQLLLQMEVSFLSNEKLFNQRYLKLIMRKKMPTVTVNTDKTKTTCSRCTQEVSIADKVCPHCNWKLKRVIKADKDDKPIIDSMLDRMKKVQEYDEKIKHLRDMRETLIEKVTSVDTLIADFQRLRSGIA